MSHHLRHRRHPVVGRHEFAGNASRWQDIREHYVGAQRTYAAPGVSASLASTWPTPRVGLGLVIIAMMNLKVGAVHFYAARP